MNISEKVITDIDICVEEIGEQTSLTPDELFVVTDILLNSFSTKLSEHSNYIDSLSGDQDYEYETYD